MTVLSLGVQELDIGSHPLAAYADLECGIQLPVPDLQTRPRSPAEMGGSHRVRTSLHALSAYDRQ